MMLQYLPCSSVFGCYVILSNHNTSALADYVISTGHNLKWDHFETLATGKSDRPCILKETLFNRDLQPSLIR